MQFFCNILFVKKINLEIFFVTLFRKFSFHEKNMFLELFDFEFFFFSKEIILLNFNFFRKKS